MLETLARAFGEFCSCVVLALGGLFMLAGDSVELGGIWLALAAIWMLIRLGPPK